MSDSETLSRAVTILESTSERIARVDSVVDELGIRLRVLEERDDARKQTIADHEARLRKVSTWATGAAVVMSGATFVAAAVFHKYLGALLP